MITGLRRQNDSDVPFTSYLEIWAHRALSFPETAHVNMSLFKRQLKRDAYSGSEGLLNCSYLRHQILSLVFQYFAIKRHVRKFRSHSFMNSGSRALPIVWGFVDAMYRKSGVLWLNPTLEHFGDFITSLTRTHPSDLHSEHTHKSSEPFRY